MKTLDESSIQFADFLTAQVLRYGENHLDERAKSVLLMICHQTFKAQSVLSKDESKVRLLKIAQKAEYTTGAQIHRAEISDAATPQDCTKKDSQKDIVTTIVDQRLRTRECFSKSASTIKTFLYRKLKFQV